MQTAEKYLLSIAGPTAVGKTEVALKVAQHFATEIISADSRQVYREMVIGTAAPDAAQLAAVKHHLCRHRPIQDPYNVSVFEQEVLEILGALFLKTDTVVITGGSGMYLDVVAHGIDDLPDIAPELREELKGDLAIRGIGWLQQEVERIDPDFFSRVDKQNPNRLLRALEIYRTTGEQLSTLQRFPKKERPFRMITTGLMLPRAELHVRINQRVDRMMEKGLLEECRSLFPYRHLNALNTVGYKELFQYLDGNTSLAKAVEDIKTNTRRYARRQITWFSRHQHIRWFHPDDTESLIRYAEGIIGISSVKQGMQ